MSDAYSVFKEFRFEAAHRLPNVPPGHKCANMHGHSYRIEVHVCGELVQPEAWVIDFAKIAEAFEPLRLQLDHHELNSIEGLENPTSEVLAHWIWNRLKTELAGPTHRLLRIVVRETATSGCSYEPGRR